MLGFILFGFQAFMTMAAEIKNRVGPPAAAQPGAAGNEGLFGGSF